MTLDEGPYTRVDYDDLADFKRHNADCCRVLRQVQGLEEVPASFFDRIMGTASSFVEIRFVVRYRDASGRQFERKRSVSYPITNCGVVWN